MSDNTEKPPEEPKMEFHKPKPVHNWREFAKEYVIIVLGVATALAAEQGVEWLHWRSEVAQVRAGLAIELGRVMQYGIERVRTAKCTEDRLNELARILDSAMRSGKLPPIGSIGSAPTRPWVSIAWQSVTQSQTASHFSSEELNRFGLIYNAVPALAEAQGEELKAWSDLSTMTGPGRPLNPSLESTLQTALARARYLNRFMASIGGSEVTRIAALKLPFTAEDQRQINTALHAPSPQGQFAMCAPLSDAPSTYGQQAPYEWVMDRLKALQNEPPFRDAGTVSPPK
ncbi:MAG: hypothetical protein JO256_03790 [Alphaproteobacteria bacterium]|nr:hypothetical protein [Alphaproteobacteria bacterium]